MTEAAVSKLATALADVQAELQPAVKDAVNPHLRNRYADLASCWDALRAILPRHGLSVAQYGCITADGKPALTTVLLHASGERLEGVIPLLIGDPKGITAMQALGSAISYARRYGLAAMTGLIAEDDDGNGTTGGHKPPAPPAAPSQTTQKASSLPPNSPDQGKGVQSSTLENQREPVANPDEVFQIQTTVGKLYTKNGKGWTATSFKADDGKYLSTLDASTAAQLGSLSGTGEVIGFNYRIKKSEKGELRNIVSIAYPRSEQPEETSGDDSESLPF